MFRRARGIGESDWVWGGVFLTVGEIKEKKEKGKEGEGEKREFVEEMALI